MITTVVTTSTVTTVTTIAAAGLAMAISIAAVVSLISFLTMRELAGARDSSTSLRIARFVSVGILPLVITFAVIVAIKVAEVLA